MCYRFHQTRHPRDLGPAETSAFLTDLAVHQQVAASTQNQARSALLFLYREVLGMAIDTHAMWLRPEHPTVYRPC